VQLETLNTLRQISEQIERDVQPRLTKLVSGPYDDPFSHVALIKVQTACLGLQTWLDSGAKCRTLYGGRLVAKAVRNMRSQAEMQPVSNAEFVEALLRLLLQELSSSNDRHAQIDMTIVAYSVLGPRSSGMLLLGQAV
jgi:hypothetical protein